jgi:hypothetical protein
MEGQVNAYQGLNKDMGYDAIPNNLYIDAVDIRITTDKGESMGSFTNLKGNEQSFTIPQTGAQGVAEIIGFATIRNKIVVFVADDSGNNGWIYLVMYDPGTRVILPGYPQLLKFDANFNFKKSWPIKGLGRYENDRVQRIYWLDYNNYFRSINIVDPNLSTTSLGLIDVYPDITYTQPLLKAVNGGGAMLAGSYQVAYRLITSDGKQTLVSPPSNVFHIVQDSESSIQSAMYNGDILDTVNTGKSITVTIDTSLYSGYESIELIVIRHTTDVGLPIITSAEIKAIGANTSIDFIYTGIEITEYILENLDYIRKNFAFKTAKTLAQKDSSVVLSNIKESSLSIQDLLEPGETFDAKTYRYRNFDGLIEANATPYNLEYNKDAQWDPTWHESEQWKYQADGLTLGGQGVNISYGFHLEPFTLDGSTSPGTANVANIPDATHNLSDGYSYQYNSTFPNAASPFITGLLRGYKRGEVYRFGIIFYTKKGEATFVEYIGDIKFPDISETDKNDNLSGSKYFPISKQTGSVTTGYALGISFRISFASCPSITNQIESFQIVRVKREEKDKKRPSQGTVKGFYIGSIGDKEHDFDLQYNGSENVMHLFPYAASGVQNGAMSTLVEQSVQGGAIFGDHLGFYSPEISFDKNNVRTIAGNISNSPFLLITGAYNTYAPTDYAGPIDLTSENLPVNCYDKRSISRTVLPVQRGHENCKKMKQNQIMVMGHDSDYTTKVTPQLFAGVSGSYYLRNYYAIASDNGTATLNDPKGGEFWRAGTSALTVIDYAVNDPITGTPIDYSFTGTPSHNFPTTTEVRPLNPATGLPDDSKVATSATVIDLVLPKSEIYGGYTEDALINNVFIPASPVLDITTTGPIVYGGDTFISMYLLQAGMLDFNGDLYDSGFSPNGYTAAISKTDAYPVETTINLDLAYGSTTKTGVTYLLGGENREILRQETNNYSTVNGKTLIMYDYNMRYSVENKDLTFFVKPANVYSGLTNDIRGYISNVKINGELVDSWTKFGANNFYDVDDYGPINEILNFKDTVFFFQDRGVGMYNINKAAILSTTDGLPTQLGTGQGFQKHLYVSKESGSIHQWAIKATESAIYYFDAIQRKLNMLMAAQSGQSQNAQLSELKGIHSFINSLPPKIFLRKENGGDNPVLGAGVVIGKDKINDEVLFTYVSRINFRVLDTLSFYAVGNIVLNPNNNTYYTVTTEFTTDNSPSNANIALIQNSEIFEGDTTNKSKTLVYDELAEAFSSFYSATPSIYLENGDILLSANPTNPAQVYTHNIGDWGSFYGNVEEMSISLVINPNADINKVLRFLEYNSIVRDDAKVIDRNATITAIKIDTQYQTTGKVPYSTSRIKRRFDKWRVKIPRDLTTQGRLRSTYFIVTLYFDNSNNKELIMNRLLSYYDSQMF